jgi:hypothetical protein
VREHKRIKADTAQQAAENGSVEDLSNCHSEIG